MIEKDTEFLNLNKSKFKFQQKNVNEKKKIGFHQFFTFFQFYLVNFKQRSSKLLKNAFSKRNTKQREKIDCFSQPMLNDCVKMIKTEEKQ